VPGLSKVSATESIDEDENGIITGMLKDQGADIMPPRFGIIREETSIGNS
jgi:hypothetical protein